MLKLPYQSHKTGSSERDKVGMGVDVTVWTGVGILLIIAVDQVEFLSFL